MPAWIPRAAEDESSGDVTELAGADPVPEGADPALVASVEPPLHPAAAAPTNTAARANTMKRVKKRHRFNELLLPRKFDQGLWILVVSLQSFGLFAPSYALM